ncbi:glycerol dehydrogenase [Acetobacter farinalis]|uniref:Glycerol dehydrogenase n=2 Tax=Acetobacter farinalis TaxID=1260984 RepID=A0ABT3Q3N2_9PROT|nr:glycerol dehydrogenase [Acetobacter farinalis]MCX2559896.1 glycerol dehydrogenase [Acetobacter farinalis]NHO28557.1 glycerol dehydrogenase [Acetobacter farinalis]
MGKVRCPRGAGEWANCLVALLLILLGLPLVIMGVQLVFFGGSPYYVLFGVTIIAGGILMLAGRVLGAQLYLVAWLCTWPWAFWQVGLNGWGLLPHLFGPTLVAIAVVLTIPVLRRMEQEAQIKGSVA